MNGTPMGARLTRRWASAAVVIGSTVAVMASPLAIGSASAAATSVTLAGGANSNQPAGAAATADINASYLPLASTTPVYFTVTGGPDVAAVNLQGTACTPNPPAGGGPVTCTVHNNGTPGVDQVIVFVDNDGNGKFTSGDASANTTVTFSGTPNAVTINPARNPASHAVFTEANTCEVYKVSAFDGQPLPAGGRQIKVSVSESVAAGAPANPFTYYSVNANGKCVAPTDPGTPGAATNVTATTKTVNNTEFFTTTDSGTVLFGLASSAPSNTANPSTVKAASVDAPAANDTDTVTWGAGGQESVVSLQAAPSTYSGYTGTTANYTVKALDAGGNPVQGVSVMAQETSGPGAISTCANPTDQDGTVTCSIVNSGSAGLVTDKFWVDYLTTTCTGGNTAGADACEPQATVTAQFDVIPTYNAHSLTCVQQLNNAQNGTGVTNCTVPVSQHSVDFSETLTNAGAPVVGAIVTFTGTGTLGGVAATPSGTATTNSSGVATFTVNDPTAQNGDFISISTKIGNNALDTATASWATPTASSLQVSPAVQSVTKSGNVSVTVKVVDQFGGGVSSADSLGYFVTGRNNGRNGIVTTGSDGSATISYPDQSINSAATTDTISVTDNTHPLLTGSSTVSYINGSTSATTVAVDTSGSGTSDATCAAAGHTAATNVALGGTTEVCAVVKNAANEALAGKTVTFTVSSGQVAAHSGLAAASTTTYAATTDLNGVAFADVTSTKSGAQTVTATADSASANSTVTYATPTVASARNIAVAPATATVTAGSAQKFTFTVTDRYGNPVPNASVVATQTGGGILSGGNTTVITGTDGTASVQLTTQATDTGTGSVTGSISAGGNQCGFAAGNPAGTTAGNCTAVATYTIGAPVVPSSLLLAAAPGAKVGTEELVAATVKNSDGTAAVNQVVRFSITGANSATGAVVTNAKGVALFGFLPKHAGTTNIVAYDDINADVVRETNEPRDTLDVSVARATEKPTITLSSKSGTVTIHVTSHPKLSGAKVTYYVKHRGNFTKIGVGKTGHGGKASQTFVEGKGVRYTFRAKVTGKSGVATGVSKSKSIKVKK